MARTTLVLLAWLCMPLHSNAQSQQTSSNVVSLRELSIPSKALHAFERGMDCLAKKDPSASLAHFQQAIAEYAGYYEAYDRIGAADLKLWRIDDAEQAFRKAIELSGGQFAHPLLALGAILNGQEKFTEAASVTRQGLNLEPDSWTGHYYLGLALFGLNQLAEAEENVQEALRAKNNFPEARLLMADIHGRTENYRAMLNDLNEYLNLIPDGAHSEKIKALRDLVQEKLFGASSTTALASN